MFTPQQLEQVSFNRATFGGYDMQAVDEFLEPLMEDYVTLYKENALLKSKMKVLVSKVEEYRATEDAMRSALLAAQKMAATMVEDAKAEKEQDGQEQQSDAGVFHVETPFRGFVEYSIA